MDWSLNVVKELMADRGRPHDNLYDVASWEESREGARMEVDVMNAPGCVHIIAIETVKKPRAHECEECVKTGSSWVHLRTCQACGVTLCCDSSPNRHASGHARASGHPVIASAERGERWLYCFPDVAYAKY